MMTRAFNPATDFPALVELLNTIANADANNPTTEEEQRGQAEAFEKYGFFEQWVIPNPTNAKEFAAYAWLYQPRNTPYVDFAIAVHPDYVETDIGTGLLETLKQAAKERGATYLFALTPEKSSFQTFLMEQGFREERGFHLLNLDVIHAFPMPEIPSNFTLRTHEQVHDINVLVEISKNGWSNLPGHTVPSYEQTKEMLETNPSDVTYLLFAADNKIIGSVGVKLNDTQGVVDSPAIVPEQRAPELYKLLVLVGLHDLTKRGCKQVQMYSWGDYDSTITAYTELGFKTSVHELGYRLDLKTRA
jgi:N-acetylglutamate synthase-like GNAT family acetyltransferase